MTSLLSRRDIESLLDQRPISDRHPWVTGDDQAVESHFKAVFAAISRSTRCLSRIEWDHYGSGYASFIDAWFYRPDASFDARHRCGYRDEHTGLVVLLSRLSPYVVFMEGEKHWDQHRGSSYMPEFDMVDRLTTPAVVALGQDVQRTLESFGMVRASKGALEEPLPPGIKVATNLANRGYTQFDALFHWED